MEKAKAYKDKNPQGTVMDFRKQHKINSTYGKQDDQQLVKLFRNKADDQAFTELLNRHQTKIYSYIYSMVTNAEVANDIFQETLRFMMNS